MRAALSERVDLEVIRLQARTHPLDRALAKAHGLGGKGYIPGHSLATARIMGEQLREALNHRAVDAVLAVAASPAVAMARPDVPVVHVTDATVHALTNYYPLLTGLGRVSRAQAEWLERRSQNATCAVVTTSRWARNSFVNHYGMAPDRVTVAPFGPAITPAPGATRDRRASAGLRVLLVANDWTRKGGQAAVAAVARLRRAGVPATLTVVGQCPADVPDWIRPAGRLSREDLSRAYFTHHVLLELARANAGGVTLTDAAAHGLPVVATNTGGVADIVAHGRSGLLVTTPEQEDSALLTMTDPAARERWSAGAVGRSAHVLNWDTWAAHVHRVVTDVSGARRRDRGAAQR